MKRNLFLPIAVAVLMVGTTVAQAADVTFSGQFRPRYNVVNDANDSTNADKNFDTRVRLNAKANLNANAEVFLQFQSVGQWGTELANANTGTRVQQGGSGPNHEANDTIADVGFHQAYLTLKNFAGLNFDAKIGRQEIVLDGHRLFGHTGWTQGAATQDAIRLTHSGGNHTIQYIYVEGVNVGNKAAMINGDDANHAFHVSTQGIMGGTLSGLLHIQDDNSCWTEAGCTAMDDHQLWYTVGARQKGKMGGLDYRVEYYHQFGDGAVAANDLPGGIAADYTGTINDSSEIDRDAHMFGIRVGKTFKNASFSPTLTLWYDRLSGTDDDDIAGGDYGGFDTIHDTGHKFYGFMDAYLHRQNLGTAGMGLQDIAIKGKMSPKAGWTIKADMHWFRTTVDMDGDNPTLVATNTLLGAATSQPNDLGSELDLTLAHKYDANTKIQGGYSHYWTSDTFALLNGFGTRSAASNDDADWFYIQIDTKF